MAFFLLTILEQFCSYDPLLRKGILLVFLGGHGLKKQQQTNKLKRGVIVVDSCG